MKPLNSRFLTVLITLAFLSICVSVPAFAAKVKDCNVPNPHPSCGGSNDHGDPPARYAVELTVGDFYFLEGIVTVTRNNRGNGYTSSETLDLVVGAEVWETVFESCSVFFGDDPPGVFLEVSNNWSIDNSGGNQAGLPGSSILIAFRDAEFPGFYPRVDIDLYLIGELPPSPGIPEEFGDPPIDIFLTDFTLFGSLRGGKGCSSSDALIPNSVLTMTRLPDPDDL